MKLAARPVEKPWGRSVLPAGFESTGGRRIGEIWFAAPENVRLPLLAKYIFTSERLSIQVHPDDEAARARGLPHGKSECWYILDAAPDARLGLGFEATVGVEALRVAAADGSIEGLMRWRPVRAGDFFHVPAGTVHAIGPGIALLEFQQNLDVTYRLYDYGRPRALHLDEALAVASRGPYPERLARPAGGGGNALLVGGPHFTLLRLRDLSELAERIAERDRWALPLEGAVASGEERATPGECLFVPGGAPLSLAPNSVLLLGCAGSLEEETVRE